MNKTYQSIIVIEWRFKIFTKEHEKTVSNCLCRHIFGHFVFVIQKSTNQNTDRSCFIPSFSPIMGEFLLLGFKMADLIKKDVRPLYKWFTFYYSWSGLCGGFWFFMDFVFPSGETVLTWRFLLSNTVKCYFVTCKIG